jgi:hypothetical protein
LMFGRDWLGSCLPKRKKKTLGTGDGSGLKGDQPSTLYDADVELQGTTHRAVVLGSNRQP